MDETVELNVEEIEATSEMFVEESKEQNMEETTTEMLVEPNYDVESNKASGNLHIMIIVVVVCAIIGLVLGIISGKKAAK